jgi:hypothetical protein
MRYGYIYKTTLPQGSMGLEGHPYYIGKHVSEKFSVRYFGSGRKLADWIKKHGTSELKIEVLQWAESNDELLRLESEYVSDLYESDPLCLNLKAGGVAPGFSEETRAKIGEKSRQRITTPEARDNMRKGQLGRKHPEWVKEKIKKAHQGKDPSPQAHEASKKACIGSHVWNDGTSQRFSKDSPGPEWSKGWLPRSEDHCRHISESKTGKGGWILSEETKRKQSESKKGLLCWNNGLISKRSKEKPGPEWVQGLLKKRRVNADYQRTAV